jgi:hypothetical protein
MSGMSGKGHDGPRGTASTLVNIFEKWDQYGYPFACHCQNLWHLGCTLRMFKDVWLAHRSSISASFFWGLLFKHVRTT